MQCALHRMHTHCIRTKFSVLEPLASAAAERRSGTLEVESACEAGGVRHVAAGSRASQLVVPSVLSAPLFWSRVASLRNTLVAKTGRASALAPRLSERHLTR